VNRIRATELGPVPFLKVTVRSSLFRLICILSLPRSPPSDNWYLVGNFSPKTTRAGQDLLFSSRFQHTTATGFHHKIQTNMALPKRIIKETERLLAEPYVLTLQPVLQNPLLAVR
jgi:hypothetical protein